MNQKQIAFGIVGVLVGFICGFFVSRAIDQPASTPPPVQASAPAGQQMPADHPSPETIAHLTHLEEQANAEKSNYPVRVELGNAFYDMGRFDLAIRWYEEAIALDATDVNVNTDLGTSYFYAGNGQKAVEVFKRSLDLEADHPQTLQNLGWVNFAAGNYDEAVAAWERLVQTNPNYPNLKAIQEQLENAKAHQRGEHQGS